MTSTYAGRCACGAIRYEIDDKPIVENHCQCRDCRRRSGTGHSSYLTFPDMAKVTITGEASTWRIAGDSGNEKIHAFCPTCGTPVYMLFAAAPDFIAIHAGSLVTPELFRPSFVTYAIRALDWDAIDPQLPKFEKMPPG